MAVSAGSVYVGLGAKVDRSEFAAYDKELAKVRAKAAEKDKYKAQLGGDFDARAFNAYQRESAKAQRQTENLSRSQSNLSKETKVANQSIEALGGALKTLFKESGLIAAGGVAVQGIAALGAAGVAAASSLAPLVGLMGSLPALATTGAQGMGVFKLATSNVFEAVGGLNEQLDKNSKKFKELDPQAQKLAEHLDSMKGPLRDLQKEAQHGFFPGFDKGITSASKNLDVFQKIVGRTSKVLGGLTADAGALVGSKGFGRDLATQGERNARWIDSLGHSAITAVDGLRHITLAAGGLTSHLVELASKGATAFDHFAETNRRNGNLQDFFAETARVLDRVLRITRDLGLGLINIFRGAYPVGRDFQISLEHTAKAFREWTESASGQNKIEHYFHRIREPAYELFKLIRDVGGAFLHLSEGEALTPLIHTIRTELLPALVHVVENTTASFGPAFLHALAQGVVLFSKLAGSSGPLVAFAEILGTIFTQLNKLLDTFPILATVIASSLAVSSIYRALGIAATLSGVTRLIGLLKTARGIAATTTISPSVTRGPGKVPPGGGGTIKNVGSSIGGGLVSRIVAAPVAATIAATAPAAIAAYIALQEPAKNAAKAMRDVNKAARDAKASHDPRIIRLYADMLDHMKGSVGGADGALRALQRRLRATADTLQEHRDKVRRVNNDVTRSFEVMKTVTEGNLGDIRRFTRRNAEDIKDTLGKNSREGREALARNFRLAADAVRDRMRETGKTTRAGTAEIRKLMERALSSLGLTKTQAAAIVDHGTVQATSERVPGGGGGRRQATGGWVGQRGEAGGDSVPIMVGAGEAVLNRHQQAVVEGLLGDGFLDRLFTAVDRPHYLAKGGRAIARGVQRFQGGGIVSVPGFPGERAASSVIPAIEAIAKRFGLTLTDAYGQGHKSPGHTRYGTAADFAGPDRSMDAAVRYLVGRGYVVGYDGRFGSASWPGHGPSYVAGGNAHLHVELGSGGAISAVTPKIKAPRIGGRGAVTALANRALGLTAEGANRQIERAAEASLSVPVGGGGSAPAGANVVSAFRRAARAAGATGQEKLALFEAGIVESGLRNLPRGDRDSVGALQQRPSQGWHGLMNPYAAAIEFLQHARGLRPFHGSAGMLAQAVQRSAYPGRYDAVASQAQRYMARGGKILRAARGIRSADPRSKPKPKKHKAQSRYLPLPKGWGWDYVNGKVFDIYSPPQEFGPATRRSLGLYGTALARAQVDTPGDYRDDLKIAVKMSDLYQSIYNSRVFTRAPSGKVRAAAEALSSARETVSGLFGQVYEQLNPQAADGGPGGDGPGGPTENPDIQANMQAILDQANSRLATANAGIQAGKQIQQAFSSSGDIGYGGFGNAFQAANNAPRITINTLHPGDPATLAAVASAANSGNSLAPYVTASRSQIGV